MKTINLKTYIKRIIYLLDRQRLISGKHITWWGKDGSIWEQKTKLSIKNTSQGLIEYSSNEVKLIGWWK